MPRKFSRKGIKRKRTFKKRTWKKRRSFSKKRQMRVHPRVKNVSSYFPKVAMVTVGMRSEWNGNSNSAGNSGRIVIPLNGLFQPFLYVDTTGGWGSITDLPPYTYVKAVGSAGTGLLSSVVAGGAYCQYKVYGCQVEVELCNTSAIQVMFRGFAEDFANIFGTLPPALSTIRNVIDNQRFGFDVMVPASTGQDKPVIWKKYYKIKDVLQLPKSIFNGDEGSNENNDSIAISNIGVGSASWRPSAAGINDGENPPHMALFNGRVLSMAGTSLSGTPATVFWRIKLKYYVQMFGRNIINVDDDVPGVMQVEEKSDMSDWEPAERIMSPPPMERLPVGAPLFKNMTLNSPLRLPGKK